MCLTGLGLHKLSQQLSLGFITLQLCGEKCNEPIPSFDLPRGPGVSLRTQKFSSRIFIGILSQLLVPAFPGIHVIRTISLY